MLLSIVTVIKLGDISDLYRTIESVCKQSLDTYEHIIVASGVSDVPWFQSQFLNKKTKLKINKDRSLYDAMNIGLDVATGDAILFLNAGDEFYNKDAVKQIADNYQTGKCLCFRTAQYFGDDCYLRPSLRRIEDLRRYPGHQGFVAPLPKAKNYLFEGDKFPISADSRWMSALISGCGVVIRSEIISTFALGGISNSPTIMSIQIRYRESGFVRSFFEAIKYLLSRLLGHSLAYRLIFLSKYDHKR